MRARYDKEIAAQPPVNEVHARHILVKTKEEAARTSSSSWTTAPISRSSPSEHTSDPSGKTNGGDLGYFGPGQMVPEFDKAASALQVGAYTKEPVQTQFGWHVIKVEDKRVKQPPAFDQVKDQFRSLSCATSIRAGQVGRTRPRSTSPTPHSRPGSRRSRKRNNRRWLRTSYLARVRPAVRGFPRRARLTSL